MADNVGYTPGSGATVAADEIGGVLYQRVKPVVGVDGTATDVSSTDPLPIAAYGELIEAIEAMRMAIETMASTVSRLSIDYNSNLKVQLTGSATNTVSVGNSPSITTLSSLVSLAGRVGSEQLHVELQSSNAYNLRNNIVVT